MFLGHRGDVSLSDVGPHPEELSYHATRCADESRSGRTESGDRSV